MDIYRTAKLMIKRHGPGARIECSVKHLKLVAAGDEEGANVWLEIADVIARWDDMPDSDTVH